MAIQSKAYDSADYSSTIQPTIDIVDSTAATRFRPTNEMLTSLPNSDKRNITIRERTMRQYVKRVGLP